MSKQTEALKLALEALESDWDGCVNSHKGKAIMATREALAEQPAQQEPVAWMDGYRNIYSLEEKAAGCEDAVIPLVPATLQHWSDCAVHNEPAYQSGKCDCGGYTSPQPAQQKIGVCGEKRGACGLPCEPCEGKTDPDYVQQPAQQHPDLSHLRPETQEAIRGWIKDGTFFDRAIGAMHEQEKQLMAYEKAQQQEPVAGVVIREGLPTLLQDKHIKSTDQRLYTSPPASKPWRGLTEYERADVYKAIPAKEFCVDAVGIAIEAKLREKNA